MITKLQNQVGSVTDALDRCSDGVLEVTLTGRIRWGTDRGRAVLRVYWGDRAGRADRLPELLCA